jgi:hypothetical protein
MGEGAAVTNGRLAYDELAWTIRATEESRMKWKRQVFLVLTLALLAVGRPVQNASGISTEQPSRQSANVERPAVYVARVISVSADGRDAFVACLRQKVMPVWQRMKRDGLLAGQSVFETASLRLSTPGAPHWNFLLLSHLAQSATPDTFFEAEQKAERNQPGTRCEEVPGVETRRVEVLHSTPNSYHPRLNPSADAQAEFTVPYIVEYAAVRETPEALNEYREIMRTTMGPVLAEAIRDSMLLNFMALETVSVRYAQPGVPTWNQIHLRGYFPDKGLVTRDALDGVIRRINPQSGGAAGVSGRLDAIRTKPREDLARQLPELAVR